MKKFWSKLTPKQKSNFTRSGIITAFICLALAGYYATHKDMLVEKHKREETKEIAMETRTLEKGLYETNKLEMQRLKEEFEQFKNSPPPPVEAPVPEMEQETTTAPSPPTPATLQPSIPPPPGPTVSQAPAVSADKKLFGTAAPPPPVEKEEISGGIEIIKNSNPIITKPDNTPDKKKDEVYLPPSYMEATLLSGVIASTTTAGKNEPTPMLLKVQDLAVLPNRVKANLKGCFVIAEGTGNLGTERIKTRLLTLSCVSRNGHSIIDQPIKGFVVDADGRVGLRGSVVAKMGVHMARATMAAFIGGFGEALSTSSFVTTTNPISGLPQQTLGDTSAGDILTAGFGKGVAKSAQEFENFYLQLAEQTVPNIEVGPTKKVTLVISEGAMLEIKQIGNPRKLL